MKQCFILFKDDGYDGYFQPLCITSEEEALANDRKRMGTVVFYKADIIEENIERGYNNISLTIPSIPNCPILKWNGEDAFID